jgi:hypothetical protein
MFRSKSRQDYTLARLSETSSQPQVVFKAATCAGVCSVKVTSRLIRTDSIIIDSAEYSGLH